MRYRPAPFLSQRGLSFPPVNQIANYSADSQQRDNAARNARHQHFVVAWESPRAILDPRFYDTDLAALFNKTLFAGDQRRQIASFSIARVRSSFIRERSAMGQRFPRGDIRLEFKACAVPTWTPGSFSDSR